ISSAPIEDVTPKNPGGSIALSKANQHLISLAMIVAVGPYSIYAWYRNKKVNDLETKFAEFLKDLAEYWKVGISMSSAVQTLARGDYGAMSTEIKKMNSQISWGVAFNDVLHQLSQRIKTRLVTRSVSLIEEANLAGGNIADVLESAAKDASEIKWLQSERTRGVFMYVVVIYIAFGVYLAVIAVIVALFLPAIIGTSQGLAETDDPTAQSGAGAEADAADSGDGGASIGGMGSTKKIEASKLTFIFFSSVLVQSVGSGLMAGMMGEGKLSAGLRHVVIMTAMSWGIFSFLDSKMNLGFSGPPGT
ncbi:MAG: type II secretion system F family protein, partial [Candidatus Thermoplasmatota archaeon]|nr:type II secretion system F family protein [Candidatus Thermoplasmatota archaeon]